jgi:hypothetical protein
MGHSSESEMPEGDRAAIVDHREHDLRNSAWRSRRLASRIVAALVEAGYGIAPANGIEDTALGPSRSTS